MELTRCLHEKELLYKYWLITDKYWPNTENDSLFLRKDRLALVKLLRIVD